MISVIIPAYNSDSTIIRCVESLVTQTTNSDFEIIVSDDGSTDATEQLMSRYSNDPNIKYIRHENVRLAENRNIGARHASGKILIFLDSDMLASSHFISSHKTAITKLGKQGVVFGSIPVADECKVSPVGRYLDQKWNKRLADHEQNPDNVFLMQGGNFSIYHTFFDEIGGFASSFKEYGGEDTDFFIRATQKYAEFAFCKKAQAYHLVPTRFDALYRRSLESARTHDQLHQRYPELISSQDQKARPAQRTAVDIFWRAWRKTKHSQSILLKLLPVLEKHLDDRSLFIIYNSLLSSANEGKCLK